MRGRTRKGVSEGAAERSRQERPLASSRGGVAPTACAARARACEVERVKGGEEVRRENALACGAVRRQVDWAARPPAGAVARVRILAASAQRSSHASPSASAAAHRRIARRLAFLPATAAACSDSRSGRRRSRRSEHLRAPPVDLAVGALVDDRRRGVHVLEDVDYLLEGQPHGDWERREEEAGGKRSRGARATQDDLWGRFSRLATAGSEAAKCTRGGRGVGGTHRPSP